MKQTKIAILGFGTVGSGVAQVLRDNHDVIVSRIERDYCIKYILDLRDFPDSPFASLITHNCDDIIHDPEVTVVAEAMGGSHPAYDFTKACLEAGKSVVTSNKEVVANFGAELLEIARAHHVSYVFEAAVGGGIPIIRPLLRDMSGNRYLSICGILNGTTNYILTRMKQDGVSFADALSAAQKLGYAEANPTADVEGLDAARKTVILAAVAYGTIVPVNDIFVEGITGITEKDNAVADALSCTVKLIGYTTQIDGKLLCMVSPRLVPAASPLFSVDDVFNAVQVEGDMLGDAMFYGRGAGKMPTASAVVGDVIDCIEHPADARLPFWRTAGKEALVPFDDYVCRRVFAFEGTVSLPAALADGCVTEKNGLTIVTADKLSETRARAIKEACDPQPVCVLRML